MAKIAFLGLGNMGRGMASNLLAAGHSLTVFNRTPDSARELEREGAIAAATPAKAAAEAEVVISMVTGDNASRAVWLGEDGVLTAQLRPDVFAIESSTVSRKWLLELAAAAAAKGLRFLDCPVAGRPDVAAAGQLAIFAGGERADLAALTNVLMSFGKSIVHFGPVGSGIAFKLIYNVMGAIQVAALAEAMAGCSAAGIDLFAASEAFTNGGTGSPHVRRHAPAMANHRYDRPVQFTPLGRIKDLSYGIDLATQLHCQSLIGSAARVLFQRMIDGGYGESNDTELFEYLSRSSLKS